MPFDPNKPYNDLALLPPRTDIETKGALKACIEARAALADLNAHARNLPNSLILINTIPVLEARASSEIENIVTTSDELFRQAELNDDHASPATKEALRYRTALRTGFESLSQKPLSTNTAINICHTIKGAAIGLRRTPGVALRNITTGAVIYTPPEGETLIRDLMANWERFIHNTPDLDPLLIMAIQHCQFEAIHPFADGNGRTGRIINVLLLNQLKLLDQPILYLSHYILNDRETYYNLLLDVTRTGRWDAWISWTLRGTTLTALQTLVRVHTIQAAIEATRDHCQKKLSRIYSGDLIDAIFAQPYCRIGNLVERGIAKRQTASEYLQLLCQSDVLKAIKVGREKIFLNTRLLDALTSDPPDFELYERALDNPGRYHRYLEKYPVRRSAS